MMQQNQSNYHGATARSSHPHAVNVLLYGTLLHVFQQREQSWNVDLCTRDKHGREYL